MAGQIYQPHITSYDYDCPISEAGGIGQPGIGGDNKFKVRQDPFILHKIASLPANADCGTPVSCRKDSDMSMFRIALIAYPAHLPELLKSPTHTHDWHLCML